MANTKATPKRALLSWSACDSKRGTGARPRSATLRANSHAEQKRGGLSWSACKASAER